MHLRTECSPALQADRHFTVWATKGSCNPLRVGIIFVLNLHNVPEYQRILQESSAVFCVFLFLFLFLMSKLWFLQLYFKGHTLIFWIWWLRACIPGSHGIVTIREKVLHRLPTPGLYTESSLKHLPTAPLSRSVKRAFCLSQSLSLRDRFQVWYIFSGLRSFSQGK